MMGWAGGLRGAKHDFYEGGLRVPFILSWPGHIPEGKVNDASIVSALDWLPTISRLAGVPIDGDRFDGEDVSKIWLGEQNFARKGPLFWKFNREESDRAMIYGNWKLFASRQGDFNLYELDEDSAESEDRIDDEPAVAQEMKEALLTWESMLPSQYCNFKNGCETPLPFDGSVRPTYVGPPKILLADDVPVGGTLDEFSKKDSGGSIGFEGDTDTAKDESVSYDGQELPSEEEAPSIDGQELPSEEEAPSISTKRPTGTPPLRAPSTPSGDNDKDIEKEEAEEGDGKEWLPNYEADPSGAQKISQCTILGVLIYTCCVALEFWPSML